jgi:hypothetical protein
MGRDYKCPKCGNTTFEKDEIRTTGTGLAKVFDVQNKRFIAITCTNCRYTEFYKRGDSGALSNIFDFLTN